MDSLIQTADLRVKVTQHRGMLEANLHELRRFFHNRLHINGSNLVDAKLIKFAITACAAKPLQTLSKELHNQSKWQATP